MTEAVIALAFVIAAATASDGEGRGTHLSQIRKVFEQELAKQESDAKASSDAWRTQYLKALKTLRQRLQDAGDLNALLIADKEAERFTGDPRLSEALLQNSVPPLAALQTRAIAVSNANETDRCRAVVALAERYVAALERLKRDLTRQNRIEDAKQVQEEIGKAMKRPEVAAAGFALAEAEAKAAQPGPATSPAPAKPLHKAKPSLPDSLRKDLVLYYPFDEDEGSRVTDASGKQNDGNVHGAAWTAKGKIGGARQFDGNDDYISHSTGSMGPDGSPYSVSLWFNANRADVVQFLFSGDSASDYPRNAGDLFFDGARSSVHFGANDRDQRVCSDKGSIDVGTWHHVVCVAEGRARHLYLDGKPVDSNTRQTNEAQWYVSRLIGRRYAPGTFFHGSIDELMVFSRALSKNEVWSLHSSQK